MDPLPEGFGSIQVDKSVVTESTGLTLSAWIRPSKTTQKWQTIMRREDSWRRQLLAMGGTDGTWGIWMGAGIGGRYVEYGASVAPNLLRDGQWHHVAGSFNGREINIYVDGKQVGSRPIEGELYTRSMKPMSIGASGDEPFLGDLNDVRVFRSGLDKQEIQELANGKEDVAGKEMVGSWRRKETVKRDPELAPEVGAGGALARRDHVRSWR